jgi:hypothetical protein
LGPAPRWAICSGATGCPRFWRTAQLEPDRKPIRNDAHDEDLHPVFSVLETDYGLAVCARRDAGPDKYYWRITPFMLPSYTIIPGTFGGNWTFTGAVPMDDTSMRGIWSSPAGTTS